MKQNCWEFRKCGREDGGSKVQELGVCTASVNSSYEGKNGGRMSGRFCWHVEGTLCDGRVQGNFSQKMINCAHCDFFNHVKNEEAGAFQY